jgi:hypothetical protein
MSVEEKREYPRKPVSWRAALLSEHYPQPVQARAVEASMGGVGLLSEKELRTASECKVFLAVPNPTYTGTVYVEVQCSVVWCSLVGAIGQYRVGLKFLSMSAEHRAMLQSLLKVTCFCGACHCRLLAILALPELSCCTKKSRRFHDAGFL